MNTMLTKHFSTSGLNAQAIEKLKISYVPASGDAAIKVPVPSARISYFDLAGVVTDFYRLRMLTEWTPAGETKSRKYVQAAKTGNHLYLAPLLDVPWRTIAHDPATSLLITEGEKKAACACLHGFPTVGLGGVWNWRSGGAPISDLDLFIWKGRKVYLAFDSPDVRTNAKVTAALEGLAAELRGRGAAVHVAVLSLADDRKVGLDDFLVGSGKQALTQLLEKAPEHLDVISELNEKFAVVWLGAKTVVMRETRRADGVLEIDFAKPPEVRPGFADRFVTVPNATGDRRVNLFDHWMQNPRHRRYERVVFEPGGCQPDEYNLWRGFSVTAEAGDCRVYLEHIRDNICQGDPALNDYVIAWMAHMVQRPGELPGTALVLRGKQGTGKGVFAHTFGALVQAHYLHLSSQRHLLGNFNAHTKDKLLFFADEAFWAGDKAAEGTLKALVTEPSRMIEHKGRDALIINNYTRLIIASNHDWIVPAGLEERRFVILDVSPARMQDTEYFARIKTQMNKRGLAALLDFLQTVDLTLVNLRQIPKTAALLDTKLRSLSGIESFWYECLLQGCNGGSGGSWGEEVSCASLYERYISAANAVGHLRRAVQSDMGKVLKRLVPGLKDVRRRRLGSSATQDRYWVFPALEKCRAAFCEVVGQSIEWEAPEPLPSRKKRGTK